MPRIKAVIRVGVLDLLRQRFVVSDTRHSLQRERRYPDTVDEILQLAVLSAYVSRPAFDDPLCVDRLRHVGGIGLVKHFRHIHDVVVLKPVPPPYIVADGFVVAGQLHQREVRPVVPVYVDDSDCHLLWRLQCYKYILRNTCFLLIIVIL